MGKLLFYPVGCTPACHGAAKALAQAGVEIADHITPEATHLLMDVPSFSGAGVLKSGAKLEELLSLLPSGITLVGGNIPEKTVAEHPCIDLLQDAAYLYENAALTAECALRVAGEKIGFSFRDAPVLVVGWGRIGKHLCRLLRGYGARVTVLSRKAAHLAEAASLGLSALTPQGLAEKIGDFRLIFNTAPGMMVPAHIAASCQSCLKIDLASVPGIGGADVIQARGLPGLHVPESAGKLIARTALRLTQEGQT